VSEYLSTAKQGCIFYSEKYFDVNQGKIKPGKEKEKSGNHIRNRLKEER
jgi:hypothetical protein